MKRLSFVAALASVALFGCAAQAQTYQDWSGTIIPGITNVPFPYTHMGPGQYNFTPSTSTALNPPSGARYAVVCSKVRLPSRIHNRRPNNSNVEHRPGLACRAMRTTDRDGRDCELSHLFGRPRECGILQMMRTFARFAVAASIFLTPSTQYAQMVPGVSGPMSPTSSTSGSSVPVTPSATPPCLLDISVSLCTGGLS